MAGEVEPDVSAEDAHDFMRLLDALYDSAKKQKKIYIAGE
jgi:predicted dehydrogenase